MKRYAPNIADDMILWTPVIRKMCTLAELKTVYSYDDLCDMHEAIGLQDAIADLNKPVPDPRTRQRR